MFSRKDMDQIDSHGLTMAVVEEQIENFRNGFPPSDLHASAVEGNGILKFNDKEVSEKISFYDNVGKDKEIVKFVPASGAASRMFKTLFSFLDSYDGSEEAYSKMVADQGPGTVYDFFKRLEHFAFYEDLKQAFAQSGVSLSEAHLKKEYSNILKYLLTHEGLDYGNLPKGLLKFHKYSGSSRTPVEEHIVEGCQYAKTGNRKVRLHFTVSPEHLQKFEAHIGEVRTAYEARFSISLDVTYSIQQPSTDTIAVDPENEPFRENDGSLLFRPAGHGALLENLNNIDGDVIFLKNIDNIVPDRLKDTTITYKKVIGGVLLEMQEKIFGFLHILENSPSEGSLSEIKEFIARYLGLRLDGDVSVSELQAILNRPIRVCGMVKSDGDPGGGPFWVKSREGKVSLQIVETAQIDTGNPQQLEIMRDATHFNPVDLVCGVKNHKGDKFDLLQYRDPSTGFITLKSKDGKDLKAQELPGLWNGGMADWITFFVEVPLITFNPVKAVTDLLKDEHQ